MDGWRIAAIAAVVLAAGCGSANERANEHVATTARKPAMPSNAWASRAELRWLRAVGAWENEVVDAARRVPETARANGLASALTPLTHCGDLLRNDVGPPPTARLTFPYNLLRRSCGEWRSAGEEALATDADDPSAARRRAARAVSLLRHADSLLPPGELRRLPRGAPSVRVSRVVPTFASIASTLARKRAEVRCWSTHDWPRLVREEKEYSVSRVDERAVGITSLTARRINLHPKVCATLRQLASHEHVEVRRAAFAVQVLAHEAQHAAGVADEATADCYGMQSIARTAQLLGLGRAYGDRLATAYWRRWPALPKIYRSPQCRNGGRLDLHRSSARWP